MLRRELADKVRNVKRFRGGLVFEAHRLLYRSTLGLTASSARLRAGSAPPGARRQGLPLHGKRFRGGLVFKAHILLNHSTLGWMVIKKKKRAELAVLRRELADKVQLISARSFN